MALLKRMSVILLLTLVMSPTADLDAAQIGIKCIRAKREYPRAARYDLERFHKDRINTVMLSFSWAQLEPFEGDLDEAFLKSQLLPVLKYAGKNKMTVILASHCCFWGDHGDWSMPRWVKSKKEYRTSTSVLTDPVLRACHISYLKRLMDETRKYPGVTGYNILNEPVSAGKWYFVHARQEFDERWDGVLDIVSEVKQHMVRTNVPQFLIIGNASCDIGFERYMWDNTGKVDLKPLWTKLLDPIAAQGLQLLAASVKWYGNRPKIRTEVSLNFTLLKAMREANHDFSKIRTQWSPDADYTTVFYDYDSAYDYEGLATAAVPNLKASYVWRVGQPSGSSNKITLLDHRHLDRPTPYYWALRDLASGVDSFETLEAAGLPKNGAETRELNPKKAKAGISKRWSGSGSLTGQKDELPFFGDSTICARMVLAPGQSVLRSVVSSHWKDNGVTAADSFTFRAKVKEGGNVTLVVKRGATEYRRPVVLKSGRWKSCNVSMKELGLTDTDIGSIDQVGFANESGTRQVILLDDFLIR
ncbi:MAG: cellulase family glycosylhydrolase [Candidatus Omnitrophica bacterium]|nr:cellulase family glycosylhydrolase [Candidatus Omnitrophota bacterium]